MTTQPTARLNRRRLRASRRAPQANEMHAHERTVVLARDALNAADFERLVRAGASGGHQVAAITFQEV